MLFFKHKLKKSDIKLPTHIAIIMDGNGRWAKMRSMPRTAGHKVGAETFINIAKYCNKIGIEHLTVYAFSTENWKRPKEEVDALMNLIRKYFDELEANRTLYNDNIKVKIIGDKSRLDADIVEKMNYLEQETSKHDGLTLNIAINYGGRPEIVTAIKSIANKIANNEITLDDIDENLVADNLYTKGQPYPDLVIRTGGEYRISNFLTWQSAYSEFIFTNILWPDFKSKHIDEAIYKFSGRNRRFGGL